MGAADSEDDRRTVRADAQGLIRHWGSEFEALLGHTPEQALGRCVDLIIPTPLHAWHWRGFDKALRTGVLRKPDTTVRVPAVHRDGHLVAVEGRIGLTRDEDGAVDGAQVTSLRADSTWMAAVWKPTVALIGLAGRAGLRPRNAGTGSGSGPTG